MADTLRRETFPEHWLSHLPGAEILGKLSLEDYSALLSRASVGLSLMLSPHPSYPPLEMAYAGVRTITNNYECKNLSRRSPLIDTIDVITPEEIAKALDRAVTAALGSLGKITAARVPIADLPISTMRYDPASVIRSLFD